MWRHMMTSSLHTGRDVVLLESKVVGSGRSGRNEGTLTSWKKCQMHNLSGKVAAEAAQSHLAAQSFIKEASLPFCSALLRSRKAVVMPDDKSHQGLCKDLFFDASPALPFSLARIHIRVMTDGIGMCRW